MEAVFHLSERGKEVLVLDQAKFSFSKILKNGEMFWRCTVKACKAKVWTLGEEKLVSRSELTHNHAKDVKVLNRQIDSDTCGDSLECVENKLKTFVDNLENEDKIGDFISLRNIGRANRQVKEKEDFIERCFRFLREHELRIRLPESIGRSLETESRSKRLRKLILPIILLLKLKAAIVIPIVLSLISFLAFTGFKSGLAALAISGAVALKSFIEHHGSSKISYEILPSITSAWSRTGGVDGAVGTVPVTGYQSLN